MQLHIPDTRRQFWIRTDASDFAVVGVLEQRRCKRPEPDAPTQGCGCPLFPVAFCSRKLQGDKSHGQRARPVRDKETYAIVATLHKFHAWLQQSRLFLKSAWVATDHRSLEYMTKEDSVTVSGPVGRRGRWHQFLSQFLLDVVYVPGQNQEIPDTLSRWSYPAYLYSPETNIHGTEEDAEGVAADQREQRAHADQLLERVDGQGETQPLRNFVAWHSSLLASGVTPSNREVGRVDVFQDDAEFSELAEQGYAECAAYCSQVRNLFSVEGLPRKARRKAQRIAITQGRGQNWSARALGAALQCAPAACIPDCDSDEPWATVRAGRVVPPEASILHDDCTAFYEQDPHLMGVLASLRQEQASLRAPGYAFYSPRPDCLRLRYRGKHVVPQAISQKVVQACHTYVHGGVDKTFLLCDRKFYFPDTDLRQLVRQVCGACQVCQQTKPQTGKQHGEPAFYPDPDDPFTPLAIDLVSLPKTVVNGETYDYLMVVVCRLTGYILAIPTQKLGLDSRKLAEIVLERVVFFMGLPKEVYSDNASVLSSQFLDTLFSLSGIEQHSSVPYKPSTNGRAQLAVRTVVMALRHFLTQRPRSWYQALPLALWGWNDLPGLVAPYSPDRLVFGRDPVGFGEVPPTVPGDGAEDAQQFFSRLVTERQQVKTALKRLHDKESSALRKKFKVQPFRGGDRVWLRDRPKWDQPH